jgi:hypothetical protein
MTELEWRRMFLVGVGVGLLLILVGAKGGRRVGGVWTVLVGLAIGGGSLAAALTLKTLFHVIVFSPDEDAVVHVPGHDDVTAPRGQQVEVEHFGWSSAPVEVTVTTKSGSAKCTPDRGVWLMAPRSGAFVVDEIGYAPGGVGAEDTTHPLDPCTRLSEWVPAPGVKGSWTLLGLDEEPPQSITIDLNKGSKRILKLRRAVTAPTSPSTSSNAATSASGS